MAYYDKNVWNDTLYKWSIALKRYIRAVGLIRITNSNSNIRITRKEAK